jgi:hypothetical protein
MELKARVNKDQFIIAYINIWNGGLRLTDKEIEFLKELLDRYLSMEEAGLKQPYLNKILFSKETMSEIKAKLSLSNQGMFNYRTQLIEKKVLRESPEGMFIDPRLIPRKELTFKFDVYA